MPNFQALSFERHGAMRWQRCNDFRFASGDAVLPLVANELAKVAVFLPIAFAKYGEGYLPVVVLGLRAGSNVLVAPNGRWVGSYIPVAIRHHPFRILRTTTGQQVLGVDEDSPLLSKATSGEAFFTESGEPAPAVREVLAALRQQAAGQPATAASCAVLEKHGLIAPWKITVQALSEQDGDGDDAALMSQQLAGLYRVDEAALNQLSGEALLELRKSGALAMAYCQLLSKQHLPLLGKLTTMHEKAMASVRVPTGNGAVSGADLLGKGGTISFSNLH